MTDYKALYEAQVEENKKLKEEHNKFNEIWKTEGITEQDIIDMKRQISNQSDLIKEIKKKSMKSISKLGREKNDLKKEHDRMSAYMYSREIKYCDKCRKYGDYHEGYGDFVYNDDTCEYICHECNED